jgi:23S rRNA (uracil1939-C5)-methyltransferase
MPVDGVGTGHAGPAPLCPHFGVCGGCAAQDKDDAAYRRWKRGFVEAALRRAGVAAEVAALVSVSPASRRRARFFASSGTSGLSLGFHGRASHDVVDMTTCRVLDPGLFALTDRLREYFRETLKPGQSGEAEAQIVSGALDVLIRAPGRFDLERRQDLVKFAREAGVARVSWQDLPPDRRPRKRGRRRRPATQEAAEVVAELRPITARFGEVAVALPPMAFLQASAAGEALLVDAVTASIPDGARVADLYSGAGTFTFPLASSSLDRRRKIASFDGDEALIAALDAAARGAGLGASVTGNVRNLARRPLRRDELDVFDAVVMDPPRGGAQAQARELAPSAVPLVVMVSCDPASFARDAKILMDGGFTPGPVTPVDQFVWTRHVELVARFSR